MVFCAIFSVKSVIRPIQARVVAFLKQNIPLFQIDGQITRDNFEEVFMAACNIKPLSLKTYNNHNSPIGHIERHHKPNPQEVTICAKVPDNNTST